MEEALGEFVDYWKKREEIVGILLSGSYAVGLQKKNSDIDIRLILDTNKSYAIKGLQEIDGFSFSYLSRTKDATIKRFNLDFFMNSKVEARIFNVGKILYEKNDVVQEIKEIAKYYHELPFIRRKLSEDNLKAMMYILYSRYNYLMEIDIDSPFFLLNFAFFVKSALEFYARIFNLEMVIDTKLENLLFNKEYARTYNFEVFPDKNFVEILIASLSKDQINKENLTKLFDYLKNKLYPYDLKNIEILILD